MAALAELKQMVRFPSRLWRTELRRVTPAEGELPLRAELFGLAQLESQARSLASGHDVEPKPGPERMLRRLDDNERVIQESHDVVAEAVRRGRQVAPAAEWLLDNYYLIEEQIDLARAHLPPGYSRELPRLRSGPLKGYPRVYSLVLELVLHTDGRVDLENVTPFVEAYQSVRPLKLGELWAIPIMLRLTLLENLRRVAYRIAWRRRHRDTALEQAQRFLEVVRKEPKLFITELADFVRSSPPMTAPFIAELAASLQGIHPVLGLAINWIEQELSERGQTLELIQQAESQDQAADQLSISNSVTSLRTLGAIDWRNFVELLSTTEAVLRHDPLGVFAHMDFGTRDSYRHVVEDLARRSGRREEDVAEAAVRLAADRRRRAGTDRRESHVGYFLVERGREELEREVGYRPRLSQRVGRLLGRRPLGVYLLAIGAFMGAFAAPLLEMRGLLPDRWGWFALLAAAALVAVSRSAISLVNWAATVFVPPRRLPRLDFSEGIPPGHRTVVVVPMLLASAAQVKDLIERIEIRYLANRTANLLLAILTDFPDAAEETLPEDEALLEVAVEGVRRLNSRYAEAGEGIFFLLHRPRRWNPSEGVWMGHERKRGKLEEFNRLLREGRTEPFCLIEGDPESLRSARYVITLDSDTQLPPETAWKMVGTMAHPLNRPRIDPAKRCVVDGYGVLQPRLGTSLLGAQQSRFARLFAGEVGIDPYTREVSNVYHDVFGRAQFVGKGIYDVEAFHVTVGDRFPENRILSHDLIEGCHARCGFIGDVELVEDHPGRYLTDVSRRHRWARGDWQIARWLLATAPGPGGTKLANPLGPMYRWMIFDNLRRSLVPAALLVALVGGCFAVPGAALVWTAALLAIFFLPGAARMAGSLLAKGERATWVGHLRRTVANEARLWAITVLELAFLPYEAFVYLGAMACVFWRLFVSGRRLLEWQTSADAERNVRTGWPGTVREMWTAPVMAAGVMAAAVAAGSRGCDWTLAAPISALWFVSPLVAWLISRPLGPRRAELTAEETLFLRRLARRTWTYFEHLVGPGENWLPPDNLQEMPPQGAARRTSPTNIGMALLGNLAAYDFGYAPAGELLERTEGTVGTLEKLDRYRGHFLNWYNTQTLQPLHPRYVSTVDSGNLAGDLITLKAGLRELIGRPILPERWREGLEDVAGVLLEEAERAAAQGQDGSGRSLDFRRVQEVLREQVHTLRGTPQTLPAIHRALGECASALAALESAGGAPEEVGFWLTAMQRQCEGLRREIVYLVPWLDDAGLLAPLAAAAAAGAAGGADPPAAGLVELAKVPRLDELATLARRVRQSPEGLVEEAGLDPQQQELLRKSIAIASEHAGRRIARIQDLATRCEELAELDLDFLYDPARHLLSIGFNLELHRRDPGNYDLLASEARFCSFIGVARGLLPMEHWFHLGRQLAPGGGPPVLVSWSGSLFEYLMPLLMMPTFEGTLLHQSCRGAVRRQVRYARAHGIPWGFSESCYNQVDAQMAYQYRAFGVPDMGLKRGLADDLVVAPYAAAMGLMVAPQEACANLESICGQGAVGRFGLYEAVDYTPSRVQRDDRFAVVRTYMAHHSGMTLLSLAYALLDRPMQRRFLGDLQFRASELLLQERIPVAQARAHIGSVVAESPARGRGPQAREAVSRFFSNAETAIPEVHLLSNGRYHVMVTNAGGGFSRWEDLALTRWREDATRDNCGSFFYVREVESERVWSTTYQPMCRELDRCEATYSQGIAEFVSVQRRIEVHTQVAVSPEDDVELRQMVVTNLSNRSRTVELTSYAEVAFVNPQTEARHPVFHGLFVETELVADKAAILCARRPRSGEETWPRLFHTMIVHGVPLEYQVSFETDRERFVGRGRTPAAPAAMDAAGPLGNGQGPVLDPVLAIRRRFRLAPGQSVTVDSVMGVGETREAALSLVDKYHDHRLAERVFELVWTHSQVVLHQLRASEAEAQLFGRLASSILYANARYRANASQIARNRKGQSALWSYAVSGDLPIVLLRIGDQTGLDLVARMIQAHAYWRHKGLLADLVIWAEAFAGYRQSLVDAIIGLVNASPDAKVLDQAGGIFVRNIEQVPEDDRLLMQSVARIILSDRAGTLTEQLDRRARPEMEVPRLEAVREPEERAAGEEKASAGGLVLSNGLGGFTADGREYVILLDEGVVTPAPWANVLANRTFGSVVSESGSAYTWYQNAHEFRLTPWYNDPVCDAGGEAFYLRDEETGRVWSPTPGPARGRGGYVCRHGLGYSAFDHAEDSLFTETFTYVAVDAPVKFVSISVRNQSSRTRRVSVTGFCEWVLGETREKHAMHVATRLDPQSGAVFAWNAFNFDFCDCVGFFHCSHLDRTLTADRTEFIGRNGSPAAPAALRRRQLSNRVGAALDPCAAIQAYLEIPAGQQAQVVFALGAAQGEQEARSLLQRFGGVDGARQALEAVWQFWKHQLGGVYVETPDLSVNFLVNHWLLYQALASRFWGRSGYYQSGGAYGFRDQLQDSLAFLYECPWLTREHLLRCASRQFRDGDVQHWWHAPTGRGVRSCISDDSFWLPYVACRYVKVTGDVGILDEEVPFLEGRPLAPGEESYYEQPQVTEQRGTLYEHCVRAIKYGLQFGPHGLPLIKCGDWNDGMNRVGRQGQGESVWLGFFLYDVLTNFAGVASSRKDRPFAERCRSVAAELRDAIEANAWDGRWYLRAFFDDGQPLGSSRSAECQIDSLPQSWAVLSGAADPARSRTAMRNVADRLVDRRAGVIKLFDPPFDSSPLDPGYIKGYVPGVRENGGQYTHAAIWVAMALAARREADAAWELFHLMNPIRHSDTAGRAGVYKVEPYVVAADVYTAAGHEGRGGWTWYTGSAGWMYQLLVEQLLGLRREVETLVLAPLFPPGWSEYTIHYRHRNTFYHIRVTKVGPNTWEVRRLLVDGVEQADRKIHLVDDGREHFAEAEVG